MAASERKQSTTKKLSATKSIARVKSVTTKAKTKSATITKHKAGVNKTKVAASVKRTRAKKSVEFPKNEAEVALPSNMSLRSIEKSEVLQREFDHFYRDAMYRIAYVSGLCFLLVGISYVGLNHIGDLKQQSAQTIIAVTGTGSTLEEQLLLQKTEFDIFTDIPNNVVEDIKVSFMLTYVKSLVVYAVPVKGDLINGYKLEHALVSDSKYAVTIPKTLPAGYYRLKFRVLSQSGETMSFESRDFFMGSKTIEDWYNKPLEIDPVITEPIKEVTTDPTDVSITNEPVSTLEEEPIDSNTTTKDTVVETNETEVTDVVTTNTENEPTVTTDTAPTAETALTLTLNQPLTTPLAETAVLTMRANKDISFVELYARGSSAATPTFIGLGIKRTNVWVFQFNTKNLPNGTYSFFARTKVDGKIVTSSSVSLPIKNAVATNVTTPSITPTEDRTVFKTEDVLLPVREAAASEIELGTNAIILDNQESLNTLFERYASAKQTGDESLITAAKEAITDEQNRIAISTATNLQTRVIADSLQVSLEERIAELQNRIDTFESLRKERSEGKSAVDTDGDGISDIDEISLYKTDPQNPDSDDDGFADGVEIVRGYNPNDNTPEAIISFESPKESVGLVRDDVLKVEVKPVQVVSTNAASTTLNTEISGVALPNSFVTIYIFSTPTVVSVRTDADGAFVYTFDKELEDGSHDVYVAITDNAGEIIAQSSPFSFVKSAQAITPVAAAGTNSVSPTPITTETKQAGYNIAIGIGILSFGLILFMLGISLRKKNEEDVIITENTATDSTNSDITL